MTLARRSFAPVPASAGDARRFVESELTGDAQAVAYTAMVLVSELVANAVLHSRPPLDVAVSVEGEHVRVEVHDGSNQLPVRKNYSSMSGTGRGLMMVERMSSDWGAEPTPTGKVVWFQLEGHRDVPAFQVADVDAI